MSHIIQNTSHSKLLTPSLCGVQHCYTHHLSLPVNTNTHIHTLTYLQVPQVTSLHVSAEVRGVIISVKTSVNRRTVVCDAYTNIDILFGSYTFRLSRKSHIHTHIPSMQTTYSEQSLSLIYKGFSHLKKTPIHQVHQ